MGNSFRHYHHNVSRGFPFQRLPASSPLASTFWSLAVLDGIRRLAFGERTFPEGSLFPLNLPDKLGWLVFAVPALLVILVGAGLAGYYTLGQSEYNRGIRAHRDADCESAVKHFGRVSSLYELTFNPWIATADQLLAECEVLLAGDQAYQDGLYEEAIQHYQDYLKIDSDTLLLTHTDEVLSTSYSGWAAVLMGESKYQDAIEKYLIILEEYPDTAAAEEVPEPLAEAYLMTLVPALGNAGLGRSHCRSTYP